MNHRRRRLFVWLATLHTLSSLVGCVAWHTASGGRVWIVVPMAQMVLGFAASAVGYGVWTRERLLLHATLTVGGVTPWVFAAFVRVLDPSWTLTGAGAVVLAATISGVSLGILVARRWWPTWTEGDCWRCGYDRRATPIDAVCPECGAEYRPIPDPDSAGV